MEITLDILWHSKEDRDLIDAGVEVKTKLEDCNTLEHTFYNIDFIRPYTSDEKYTIIGVSTEEYLTKVPYNTLKKRIRAQQNLLSFFN